MSAQPSSASSGAREGVHRRVARGVGLLVALWVVMTGLLMLAGAAVEHSSLIRSMDQSITTFVVDHRTPALNQLMKVVTWMGSWFATLGVAILVIVLAWRRRLPLVAVAAILAAWWGELLATTISKAVVQRPRPPQALRLVTAHGWSFPSGHAANAVVVFATAAVLATAFAGHAKARVLTWAVAVLATALVGFSRIELGVHWTTDVVASLIWTTTWVLIVVNVLRRAAFAQLLGTPGEGLAGTATARAPTMAKAYRKAPEE